MKNETFTPERIKAEADAFFEWDGEDRSLVTTTSCLLFAQHIAGLMQARAAQPAPVVPEGCMPIPTAEQLAEALSNVGCFHDMSAELIAPDLLANLLIAAPAQGQQVEFGDAYQGAREDLAIWKRRALEAEEKLRQQGSIIDHLTLEAQGETRMGEPRIAQGQQSPNYWRDLAVANRKVADEALAELSALKAQQAGQEPALWTRQCDLDESDPALFVSREKVEESGYTVPFYPHPANSLEGEPVAYTTAGMLAIAKELPLTGRIGARCKADERWNVPLYTAPKPAPAQDVAESWRDGYRAAMNSAASGARQLYVQHCHHHGVNGLLDRSKELEQSFLREADAALAAHDKQSGEVKP